MTSLPVSPAGAKPSSASYWFEPCPPELPPTFVPAARTNPRAAFKPSPKLDSPAKVRRELDRQRRRFAKFMRNLAPAMEPVRSITPIKSFDWRLQTGADAADFSRALNGAGEWQRVSLPHYGGPIGKATAYYRTTFELDLETLADR